MLFFFFFTSFRERRVHPWAKWGGNGDGDRRRARAGKVYLVVMMMMMMQGYHNTDTKKLIVLCFCVRCADGILHATGPGS
jgi:hypothetical protein